MSAKYKRLIGRRQFLKLAGGTAGAMLLAGCQPGATTTTEPEAGEKAQEIVWLLEEEFAGSLDPHTHFTVGRWQLQYHWGDTLIDRDSNGNLVPLLAESWEIVSPTETKFKLREGVKFHNGNEFTADSVKACLERIANWEGSVQIGQWVPLEVEIQDDYNCSIKTERPFGVLIPSLTLTPMVDPDNIANADAVGQKPIGTGPFKVAEFDGATKLVLEAFDDYWQGAPQIRTFTFRYIPDLNTRIAAFITGEGNILTNVPLEHLEAVRSRPDINITNVPTYQQVYCYIKSKHEPFDDVRVRQALAKAIDRETIRDTILMGIPNVATGPIGSLVYGFTPGLPPRTYDPEGARALLEEAGAVGAEVEVGVLVGSFPKAEDIGEALAKYFEDIGLKSSFYAYEHGVGTKLLKEGVHDVWYSGCVNIAGEEYFCGFLYSADFNQKNNEYDNPHVTELYRKIKEEPDADKRQEMYDEMNAIVWEEVAMLNMFDTVMMVATHESVKDFQPMPNLMHRVTINTHIA